MQQCAEECEIVLVDLTEYENDPRIIGAKDRRGNGPQSEEIEFHFGSGSWQGMLPAIDEYPTQSDIIGFVTARYAINDHVYFKPHARTGRP